MKKIILLFLILVFSLITNLCVANNLDPARWSWVSSDNQFGYFIDRGTITFDDTKATAWVARVEPSENKQILIQTTFFKKDFSLVNLYIIAYKNGQIEDSYKPLYKIEPIIPGPIGEEVFFHLLKLVDDGNGKYIGI